MKAKVYVLDVEGHVNFEDSGMTADVLGDSIVITTDALKRYLGNDVFMVDEETKTADTSKTHYTPDEAASKMGIDRGEIDTLIIESPLSEAFFIDDEVLIPRPIVDKWIEGRSNES